MSLTRQVEFLAARDNGRWDTVTVDVPKSIPTDRESLITWAETNLIREPVYQNVVLFAVYHIPEDGL